jgi:hypothetical protein
MKKLATLIVTFATAALMSSSAFAAIDYSEDFEGYTEFTGTDISPLGGDWLGYATVFYDYPGCSEWHYNYTDTPFPAPNKAGGFSNISVGKTGKALNIFSDYENRGAQEGSECIETSVFQEVVFKAADAGTYSFIFSTQAPGTLGPDVSTYGFVKLLDPNNGYQAVIFEKVDTRSAGIKKSADIVLDASADGMILQWGFSTKASNDEFSGRLYDNVSFAIKGTVAYKKDDPFGLPIPLWALFGMAGLLALVGGLRLRTRRQA